MKIKYFQRFYTIDNTSFFYSPPDCNECFREAESRKLTSYWHVIPVYVYSINKHWDGEECFDICPVDFSKKKNAEESWRWKREVTHSEIGTEIFNTRAEAVKAFVKRFDEQTRDRYFNLKRIHNEQETNK